MEDLSKRIAELSPAKRALLESKMKGTLGVRKDIIIPRANREAVPLSFSQQRLWFLERLIPDSSLYNLCGAVSLKGFLNVDFLKRSFNEIVRRHEILRTVFLAVDGHPVQKILPDVELALPLLDLRAVPEETRKEEALGLIRQEAEQPFDLTRGPLLRTILYRLSEREHLLLVMMHHIISDEWSFEVFFRELIALYGAHATGTPAPLGKLPVQYADFVYWQREWLQDEALESQLAYWREKLRDAQGFLQLPTDRPRPAVQGYQGASYSEELPDDLIDGIKTVGRREGATLYMTLLAAFQLLLHYYTREQDILVGSPIASRNRIEIEGLIGFFVNTLVLRTNLSGNPTFRELLSRVRDMALEAYAHQDMPFEKLVEELQPDRSLSHSPLFQVMFVFQYPPDLTWNLADLNVELHEIETATAKFDLTLVVQEEDGLNTYWEYNVDLFNESTIQRMSRHFVNLLKALVADPDRHISDYSLLTPEEEHRILVDWNNTATNYPREKSIHELFEMQVARTPNADAVIFKNQKLTFAELNKRANQLAHYLMSNGVQRGTLVGICMERSIELAVALLGVLKSGGAYVPLDPHYPAERIQFRMKDSGISILLTQQRLLAQLPESSLKYLPLDKAWNTIAAENVDNPSKGTDSESLVYVIYTSGSTGQPKGVMIPHRALVNHSTAIATKYSLSPRDRVLQFASISFDVAAEELFPSWLSGACVVFRDDEMLASFGRFIREIDRQKITVLNLPTAYWHELVHEISSSDLVPPQTVRLLVIGGEKVAYSAFETWSRKIRDRIRFFHGYGPTETTVTSTLYDPAASPQTHKAVSDLPIGRPIANTRVYVLNPYRRPVPVGIPGELYIGGDGLAHGYLNREELTDQKFINLVLDGQPDRRVYSTGDIVRYLPDGNLQYLGRADQQLKIRGFRIEVGEIESVLRQNPAVKDAVVTVRETGQQKQLVAYIVPMPKISSSPVLKESELKKYLQNNLPDFMVPAYFVTIKSLPMMENGKVDYRALPAPVLDQETEQAYVPPRDSLELQLASIWEKLLSIKTIGIRDNFFELGGHSLLAVRVFSEIEKLTGRDLPLATLFQAPTIEELVYILRRQGWSPSWSCLVPIKAGGSGVPFFCIHAVGGNVIEYHDLAQHLGDVHPVYGLQAKGLDGSESPHLRVSDQAAHYIQEIRRIQPTGPYFMGGLSSGGVVAFEMAHQLIQQGEKVGLVALIDSYFPGPNKEVFFQIKQHIKNLIHAPDRLKYIRKRKRILERRLHIQIWQFINRFPENLRPLPPKLLNILEANEQAMRRYIPAFYPDEITVFLASDITVEISSYAPLEWRNVAAVVNFETIPGDHISVLKDPNVKVLADRIKQIIAHKTSISLGFLFALLWL